jgi:hypothetical protein
MSQGQKHYITNCRTSNDMWNNLIAIHQSCSDQTENQIMCELITVKAQKGDDIKEHLTKIMELWNRMMRICPNNLPMKPPQFKKFFVYSLPLTWDDFTCQLFHDPFKQDLTVSQFISECFKEYCNHQTRKNEEKIESAYAAN